MRTRFCLYLMLLPALLIGAEPEAGKLKLNPDVNPVPESAVVATFAAGCFWCVEEVFHQTPGVLSAVSGYMGGDAKTADYELVASGRTKHAEAVQVYFDPTAISFSQLLDRFFEQHDPTTLNRQGPDRGPQYRSAIFYHDEGQKREAERKIIELTEAGKFDSTIVTEVTEATEFYEAEEYHQNFARLNPTNGYLHNVLYPKMKKLGLQIPEGAGEGFSFRDLLKGSSSKPPKADD